MGCKFSVGEKDVNNVAVQVYAAHLAKESARTDTEVWNKYMKDNNLKKWYEGKLGVPTTGNPFACSYVFALFGQTGLTSVMLVEVDTGKQMGGSNGKIIAVKSMNVKNS